MTIELLGVLVLVCLGLISLAWRALYDTPDLSGDDDDEKD